MTATPLYQSGVKTLPSPLQGTERVYLDNGSAQGVEAPVSEIIGFGTVGAQVYNTNTLAASGQLTAANMVGGTDSVFLAMTGAFAGAANIQLPTYASLAALTIASPTNPLNVGSTFLFRIINPSGQTLTLTTAAGWTLNGTVSIPTETFRDYLVILTSATAGTIQDVGSGSAVTE